MKHEAKADCLYNCKKNCGKPSECTSQIKVYVDGRLEEIGRHSHKCVRIIGKKPLEDDTTAQAVNRSTVDFTEEMKALTEELALSSKPYSPRAIWDIVSTKMNAKSKTWKGLTDVQVVSKVHNVRMKANGGDVIRACEANNMAHVEDSPFLFLQFNVTMSDKAKKNWRE